MGPLEVTCFLHSAQAGPDALAQAELLKEDAAVRILGHRRCLGPPMEAGASGGGHLAYRCVLTQVLCHRIKELHEVSRPQHQRLREREGLDFL